MTKGKEMFALMPFQTTLIIWTVAFLLLRIKLAVVAR
jgi:hypothetical protein